MKLRRPTGKFVKILSQFPAVIDAPLLRDVPIDDANAFLALCDVSFAEKATPLLTQGEMAEGVFLVVEGTIEISYVSPEGHRTIIAHDGPGRTLGAIEAVANHTCAASCVAFGGATVLRWAAADFVQQLQSPMFLRNFALLSLEMLRHDNASKAVDQFYTAEQRICRYLGKLAGENQMFRQSQSYLANAVGCTRQTVNKELSYLKDQGVIAISKGRVEILDHTGLDRRIAALDERRATAG